MHDESTKKRNRFYLVVSTSLQALAWNPPWTPHHLCCGPFTISPELAFFHTALQPVVALSLEANYSWLTDSGDNLAARPGSEPARAEMQRRHPPPHPTMR